MTLSDAKKMFFDYDGSRFYMSRDGVETKYLSADVPPPTETAWLEELTEQKLGALQSKGNWKTIHFLRHHGDYRYLAQIVAVEPQGVLWERCAFLEELLDYARGCIKCVGVVPVTRAIDLVIEQASQLVLKVKSAESRARIEQILDDARSRRERVTVPRDTANHS